MAATMKNGGGIGVSAIISVHHQWRRQRSNVMAAKSGGISSSQLVATRRRMKGRKSSASARGSVCGGEENKSAISIGVSHEESGISAMAA